MIELSWPHFFSLDHRSIISSKKSVTKYCENAVQKQIPDEIFSPSFCKSYNWHCNLYGGSLVLGSKEKGEDHLVTKTEANIYLKSSYKMNIII